MVDDGWMVVSKLPRILSDGELLIFGDDICIQLGKKPSRRHDVGNKFASKGKLYYMALLGAVIGNIAQIMRVNSWML